MKGQTALITGASAGLGRELAKLAAADGTNLMLVARRRDRLEALAQELSAAHGVAVTVSAADLADPAAPAALVEQVEAAGITVDTLMNNAGFGSIGPFAGADLARQLEMIAVNVRALVELTHRFLPGMLARKQGRILNVASVAGFVPGPFMATYYASKAFVLSFTEALAAELDGTGVTVTASCPGPTKTEFSEVARNGESKLFRRNVATATGVARHAYRAMLAGTVVAVPGLMNKLMVQSVRTAPRTTLRSIVAKLNRPPKPEAT
jgi:short-subunit dehydrogenase